LATTLERGSRAWENRNGLPAHINVGVEQGHIVDRENVIALADRCGLFLQGRGKIGARRVLHSDRKSLVFKQLPQMPFMKSEVR
jgi:hypothetical protein